MNRIKIDNPLDALMDGLHFMPETTAVRGEIGKIVQTPIRKAVDHNKNFLQRYHNNVIETGRVGTDASGKSNTMLLGTIQLFGDGKEYIVPFYNPETGEEIPPNSPEEGPWLDKWREEAKKGNLVPYNTVYEAENALGQIRSRILGEVPFLEDTSNPLDDLRRDLTSATRQDAVSVDTPRDMPLTKPQPDPSMRKLPPDPVMKLTRPEATPYTKRFLEQQEKEQKEEQEKKALQDRPHVPFLGTDWTGDKDPFKRNVGMTTASLGLEALTFPAWFSAGDIAQFGITAKDPSVLNVAGSLAGGIPGISGTWARTFFDKIANSANKALGRTARRRAYADILDPSGSGPWGFKKSSSLNPETKADSDALVEFARHLRSYEAFYRNDIHQRIVKIPDVRADFSKTSPYAERIRKRYARYNLLPEFDQYWSAMASKSSDPKANLLPGKSYASGGARISDVWIARPGMQDNLFGVNPTIWNDFRTDKSALARSLGFGTDIKMQRSMDVIQNNFDQLAEMKAFLLHHPEVFDSRFVNRTLEQINTWHKPTGNVKQGFDRTVKTVSPSDDPMDALREIDKIFSDEISTTLNPQYSSNLNHDLKLFYYRRDKTEFFTDYMENKLNTINGNIADYLALSAKRFEDAAWKVNPDLKIWKPLLSKYVTAADNPIFIRHQMQENFQKFLGIHPETSVRIPLFHGGAFRQSSFPEGAPTHSSKYQSKAQAEAAKITQDSLPFDEFKHFSEMSQVDYDKLISGQGRRDDLGFHFGSQDAANRRADNQFENSNRPNDPNIKVVHPFFVIIKKPLRLHDAGTWNNAGSLREVLPERFHGDTVEQMRKNIESEGYDGIVYFNETEVRPRGREDSFGAMGEDSYILFDSNQAKSATHNIGNYDRKYRNMFLTLPVGMTVGAAATQSNLFPFTQDKEDFENQLMNLNK